MSTVTTTRTVVIVGRRPRAAAADVLGHMRPGQEAAVFVLGLDPTPAQRALTAAALSIAAERRFLLTAELIPAPSWLEGRLKDADEIRLLGTRREARRWRVEAGPVVTPPAGA
jgi:hypothetical protein